MAEKHKTKYTAPKDEAKSQKPETRKDIKDYTAPDADGMVPNLSKGIQKLVPRNINGEVIDNIENMVPKIKDHIYKKVEEGDYDPAHARKVFEKLQIEDSEGYLEAMEKGVYKMNESQKEQVIRKYVRNKIAKILRENYVMEQDNPEQPADDQGGGDQGGNQGRDLGTDATGTDATGTDATGTDATGTNAAGTGTTDTGTDTTDTGADLGGSSFSGGGGGGSTPSPSPTPDVTAGADDAADVGSQPDPEKEAMGNKIKSSIAALVKDVKAKLATATPLEVAPEVVQPIKDIMDGMTAAQAALFIKAVSTSLARADIKLPKPSPSDDYTENEA